jgi:NitT/TauT family transport system substrate-binding protein
MRKPGSIAAMLAAVLLLSAAAPAHAADKIRLGLLSFSEALGGVMADKLGYFKAEGIEVEPTSFVSAAMALPVLQSGRLDIVLSSTISTLQALEQGLDAVMLAPAAVVRDTPPDTTTALMVLKDSPIQTPKDLIGKRIAVNVINNSAWLYAVAYLAQNGVDRSQVRFVEVPFPQMNDPLLNGQVDAITQSEPFRTVLQQSGKVRALGYDYIAVQPGGDITQYLALGDWVKKNQDLAKRFARAIVRANAYVNDPANNAAVRQANMDFTHLNPALKDAVLLPRMGSAVNLAEFQKTMDLMLKYGMMKTPVSLQGRVLAQ